MDLILEWLASKATVQDIQQEYPYISEEAVLEAIRYAARYLKNEVVVEVKTVAS